jgi:diguanylate cyclase (GGDEF)-like protein
MSESTAPPRDSHRHPAEVREGRLRFLLTGLPELYRPQPVNDLLGHLLRMASTLAGAEEGFVAALSDEHLLALRSGVEGMADLAQPVALRETPLVVRASRGPVPTGGTLAAAPNGLRETALRALFRNEVLADGITVAVPVRLGLHPLGVVALTTHGSADLETLELLATHASHALQNLVLFAVDSGFLPAGYRYLTQQRLMHALRASHRRAEPCSVVFAAATGLDALGRKHGRRAADWVLHHLANGLRAAVRDTDAVGRIAPEAFLVVLPSTPVEGAEVLMRRLAAAPRQIHAASTHVDYEAVFGVAALPAPEQSTERVGAAALATLAERVMTAGRTSAAEGRSIVCGWDVLAG